MDDDLCLSLFKFIIMDATRLSTIFCPSYLILRMDEVLLKKLLDGYWNDEKLLYYN